jgi:hypothetical protein
MSMRTIPINSQELIDLLNQYVDIANHEAFEDNVHVWCENQNDVGHKEKWTSDGYLKHLINVEGESHEGFPDHMVARSFKPNQPEEMMKSFNRDADPVVRKELVDAIYRINEEMMLFLGTRNNALCAYYPPDGYISWHTNWNAPGYNLIFTWSETGEGWFKYLDPKTKKIVHCQDQPGWQLKAGYFGHIREKDKIVYHAASTDCRRITVSFIFSADDMALDLQEDVISEITGE